MNITKFCLFVICTSVLGLVQLACTVGPLGSAASVQSDSYLPPRQTGTINSKDVTEASGLAASKCRPDTFWTHNDSGDNAFIYAVDEKGSNLGTWKIPNAQNRDWEDIAEFKDAAGRCWIYIAETGDNRSRRDSLTVYRVAEPAISSKDAASSREQPNISSPADAIAFKYPDGEHDAETLMVHPRSGDIYLVTKRATGPAGVYRLKPNFAGSDVVTAEKIADISVPAIPNGFLTGGDISPDGNRVVICDYVGAYEWVLGDVSKSFDEIWAGRPQTVDVGRRRGGEAICYSADGNALFTTTEGKDAPIYRIDRKK